MNTSLDPSQSLSHVQWRATEFILAFGALTLENVMDYFVLSPFFDKSSNNAVMRMQMMYSRGGLQGLNEEEELTNFVGIEYVVAHSAAPSLFIIHKRDRTSPTEATPIAAYYILNDNIYQGPTLYQVVNERILTSLDALSTSLAAIKKRKPKWTAENLNAWELRDSTKPASIPLTSDNLIVTELEMRTTGEEIKDDEDDEVDRPAEAFNPLLFRALQSLAAISATVIDSSTQASGTGTKV